MKVKIINKSPFVLPIYAKKGDSGMDLRADFSKIKLEGSDKLLSKGVIVYNYLNEEGPIKESKIESITIRPQCRVIIPTNIFVELPEGYEFQVRPKSGQSFNKGFDVALGTIDGPYRGNVGVIVRNFTDKDINILHGERIAQLVLQKVDHCEWEEVVELVDTERGSGGFGHTGVQ